MKHGDDKARVLVLASGNGSNFEHLARAANRGDAPIEVVGLVCDRPGAGCLERARSLGLPALLLPAEGRNRRNYDLLLAEAAGGFEPDWVLLLGWMRILSKVFLEGFGGRVINLHPALPGRFPGTEAIRRAWSAARAGEGDTTGAMLHFVPDEGVDTGPAIIVRTLSIDPRDTLAEFEGKMHMLEHELVVELAKRLRRDRLDDESAMTATKRRQGGMA